jgi:hypothetical protein
MSIQSAGIFYGNWISQEHVRYAAAGGNSTAGDQQVLVAVNDQTALNWLSLLPNEWDYTQPEPQIASYFSWVQSNILAGNPVIGTVYERKANATADPDYGTVYVYFVLCMCFWFLPFTMCDVIYFINQITSLLLSACHLTSMVLSLVFMQTIFGEKNRFFSPSPTFRFVKTVYCRSITRLLNRITIAFPN